VGGWENRKVEREPALSSAGAWLGQTDNTPFLLYPVPTDSSLGDSGHPEDLLKFQCGQGCTEAAEGHNRSR
jgi:hypothetical protein